MHITKTIFVSFTLILLTACGGREPSESEISNAINKQFASQLEQSSGMFNAEDIKVHHIKKVGCTKADEKSGYLCDVDVDIDVKLPFVGTQKQKGVQS